MEEGLKSVEMYHCVILRNMAVSDELPFVILKIIQINRLSKESIHAYTNVESTALNVKHSGVHNI